jgi:predicted transcriptional regulator
MPLTSWLIIIVVEQCMRPHRSRTEIVIRILEIVSGSGSDGFTKYKIMYNAFLSYAQLKEYLTVLTDNDLLCYDFRFSYVQDY